MAYITSEYDYQESRKISFGTSFATLLFAAMSRADSVNSAAFRTLWPQKWEECMARNSAPGGRLPDDWQPSPTRDAHQALLLQLQKELNDAHAEWAQALNERDQALNERDEARRELARLENPARREGRL